MTREEKIAGAAEIIRAEYIKQGHYITMPHAVALAQKLYALFTTGVRVLRVSQEEFDRFPADVRGIPAYESPRGQLWPQPEN
jgi:hypothetical protein